MIRHFKALAFGLFLTPTALAADPWIPFDGDYTVGGKVLYDPTADQPPRSHIRFRVFGNAAREMYEMMEVEPSLDRCGTDHLTKLSGKIKCDYFEKDQLYACYFGLGVHNNDVVEGVWC